MVMFMPDRTYAIFLLAAFAVACSTDDDTVGFDTDTTEARLTAKTGTVIAEYDRFGNGTTVHAQFMSAQGVSRDQALEALEIWTPDRELAIDACSLRPPLASVDADVALQLLDLGPLTVGFGDQLAQLQSRRLPDLFQNISGVVYGNEEGFDVDSVDIPFAEGADYSFAAPGGDGAGAFDASVQAPMVPQIQAIGGEILAENAQRQAELDSGEDLTIGWSRSDATEHGLYLDVVGSPSLDMARLRCRVEDDGSFTVPGAIIDQLRAESSDITIVLRRVNRAPVQIDGLDESEIIFSAKDEASLQF